MKVLKWEISTRKEGKNKIVTHIIVLKIGPAKKDKNLG